MDYLLERQIHRNLLQTDQPNLPEPNTMNNHKTSPDY